MADVLSFQEVILRLTEYWKGLGCLVQQPYNVQVGAGTMNPATSLRVLGPEPWNVVYVEPSIRPDDGRFGDNPNRMQMHHQLQVILKPDPGNPQELYLASLAAIGIDMREHDIRFVEDNWESPVLGAWGLGWEVWLDGQEITQFTYFQQAGGINLDPVCVEITYGLDRIALALQNKRAVWEMAYSDQVGYDDVLLQSEIEHCHYYFNVADVDALRAVYDTYERESLRCIEANLVVPAHDYNLKCSHLFNVLDTRGAIGVTERANYFKRMRNIARQISQLYLEQRQRLEYPLLERPWTLSQPQAGAPAAADRSPAPQSGPQTFVLEIGQEELPADDLTSAIAQLRVAVPRLLADLRLNYSALVVDGTPRRLAVIVHELAERQSDLETQRIGPPADRAYDALGTPTRAASGFAAGAGVAVDALEIVEKGDKRYVAATVRESGRPTLDVLAEALPSLIAGIRFNKSMRWNASNIAYSRPLRWFVALFGGQVVPFSYADVTSGRVSRGLRPYGSPPFVVAHANEYEAQLAANGILLHTAERKARITAQAAALAAEQGGHIPDDAGLLSEVTNLVEAPQPFTGFFEARYLDLPAEILVAVMRKHQRYFPVYRPDGALVNCFITVRNGDDQHLQTVREGNEQVVRARFADAEFFYGKDRRHTLSDFVAELDTLMFQADLGSMLAKQRRLAQIVPQIAALIGLSDDHTATATRAAALAKADLATTMVVEMTSLQGVMGGIYARLGGEPEPVAAAIAEQYSAVSQTRPGLALALADRIDSLVGLTAAGLLPKGANDPYALRRAAIQILENLIANRVALDLRALAQIAAAAQPIAVTPAALDEVLAFIGGRLEVMLRDAGHTAATVRAVLSARAHDPYNADLTADALSAAQQRPDWQTLLDAYARCVRITRTQTQQFALDPDAFHTLETAAPTRSAALYAAWRAAEAQRDGTLATFIATLAALTPTITAFFDNVLVMDPNPAVRANRLALLQQIVALADGIADLSELEGF